MLKNAYGEREKERALLPFKCQLLCFGNKRRGAIRTEHVYIARYRGIVGLCG